MIGGNNLLINIVIHWKLTIDTINLCYKHLESNNSFTSFTTKSTSKIYLKSNCGNKNVIFFTGMHQPPKTICWKGRIAVLFRLNNYRPGINQRNNLILLEQHIRQNSQEFNGDAKFTVIERIEKYTNMTQIIEIKKTNGQKF